MRRGAIPLLEQPEGQELIEKHCARIGLPRTVLNQILKEVVERDAMQRRRGLWISFDEILESATDQDTVSDVPDKA